jgi:N-acylneuraminate cytidylyltransferase
MNVAFIPVRGGSKSIPMKNICEIAGRPLVYWTAKAACDCDDIDIVYISTDSDIIKATVEEFGLGKIKVIGRSKENASDTASTESVMLEFANQYEFDNIVLIQATSPLLTKKDLNEGFELFRIPDTDSVMSVVRQKRFLWKVDENGYAVPLNYDPLNRPRRQEFNGYLVENGAFFITGKSRLLESKNRMSGNIRVCEMDELSYFEIDEPSDWVIIEQLLKNRNRCQ